MFQLTFFLFAHFDVGIWRQWLKPHYFENLPQFHPECFTPAWDSKSYWAILTEETFNLHGGRAVSGDQKPQYVPVHIYKPSVWEFWQSNCAQTGKLYHLLEFKRACEDIWHRNPILLMLRTSGNSALSTVFNDKAMRKFWISIKAKTFPKSQNWIWFEKLLFSSILDSCNSIEIHFFSAEPGSVHGVSDVYPQ